MKIMKRLLLIHWHYFAHQMIEFDKINFLTGQNATGKSTIIDAMQMLLLCDTSGSFFNKAASSGRGNRTLTGYLRGELGDEEDSGFRYLRSGRFTSYIALEFHDDVKNTWFTAACCFDTFGENDCQKLFFRIDDRIPDHEFTVFSEKGKKVPMSIEELRGFLRADYGTGHSYTTGTNREFREDFCGKLGGIQPKRFSELLKKAVSFNPNINIREFITSFVCGDEEQVNISDLLENIRSYDILKKESENLKERISLLSQIGGAYGEFVKNRDSETLYTYLIDCAQIDIKADNIKDAENMAEQLKNDCLRLGGQLAGAEKEREQLQSERDRLKLQLDGNEDARRYDELIRQIEEKKALCASINEKAGTASALLRRTVSSMKKCIVSLDQKINQNDISLVEPMLFERLDDLRSEGQKLAESIESLGLPDTGDALVDDVQKLTSVSGIAGGYRDRGANLLERFQEAQASDASRRNELMIERQSLEEGKFKFPQDAIDLKEAIDSRLQPKYGQGAGAVIVAEASEIVSDRWRNVIEGYLSNQKYHVIVAPEHFGAAYKTYDTVKRQKPVYKTGLVDTEKLERLMPKCDNGSLAEDIETQNPSVRLYLDFVLGRVHKCEDAKELRRHKTAVTDDGALYKNFAVRAIDPKKWEIPAIGGAGVRIRLEMINKEIELLALKISAYASISCALEEGKQMTRLSDSDALQIADASKARQEIPAIEETISRLQKDADMIDRSEIKALQTMLTEREEDLLKIDAQIRKFEGEKSVATSKLKDKEEIEIPSFRTELAELRQIFGARYSEDYVTNTGKPRYERELAARGSAEEIFRAFPREQSRSRNAKEDMWTVTRDLRSKYNETYKMGLDISAQSNDAFEKAHAEYSENKFPEYESKIEDTRNKAFLQFKEDFLSRLQRNIFNAKNQIDELNAAMRGTHFGEDTYRFRATANPEYKGYHDMIVDRMTLEGGYNLFSNQFDNKYAAEMQELFDLITNDNPLGGAAASDDYEKRVQIFTDYKTYLNFDLEVVKPGGETERLSKTLSKKSGGETQTPFYIAVLASFVQLYRIGRDKKPNTIRLIIFDEAFSKMDGERIVQSIALLRRYNFQVLLSAPPDKVHDIATLVDRNLCTVREGRKTYVLPFEPREPETIDGDADEL